MLEQEVNTSSWMAVQITMPNQYSLLDQQVHCTSTYALININLVKRMTVFERKYFLIKLRVLNSRGVCNGNCVCTVEIFVLLIERLVWNLRRKRKCWISQNIWNQIYKKIILIVYWLIFYLFIFILAETELKHFGLLPDVYDEYKFFTELYRSINFKLKLMASSRQFRKLDLHQ